MEIQSSDSEDNHEDQNPHEASNDHTPIEHQLPMVTPNEIQSGNGTPTEDFSLASSKDRSPMLTPNTTQDWTFENTSRPGEAIPIEDTLKNDNLEDATQDFMDWNLEEKARSVSHYSETIPEEEISEQFEVCSVTDGHPQENMGDEVRQLPFEQSGQIELENSEAVPEVETMASHIYEEKTKTWIAEEFPNLVKMFPVHTHPNTLSDKTKANINSNLEGKIQSWVDASLLKKHGDYDWGKSSTFEKCEIVYCSEYKPEADEIPLQQNIHSMQGCSQQAVTVKFLINEIRAFTRAFDIYTYLREVKETLSKTFRCQPIDLQLIRNGIALSDSLEISELGVEPYGTVEIEIKAKGSLKMESMYDVPLVPDVITVRVETATEEVRDIVVEIESRCIKKPFVGGYRHKTTGVEYHHAFTQTPSLYFNASAEGKRSRDTQTAQWKEKLQNTTYDVATQMNKVDHHIPSQEDRILTPKEYTTALDVERHADLNAKAIIIQRWWKRHLFRKKWEKSQQELRKCIEWEKEERRRVERECDERMRKEIVRKIFPRTRADYEMLYAMVENWRKAEIKRISGMKTPAPKKAEFCLLLKKEIESLNTIERYRLELKKEKLSKKELSIIEKCAMPITWIGYNGKEVSMETVHIQRAKELKELYYIMCQDDVTTKERIELLISLKYALKSYNPMMTNELISLFERECNCLVRGVKAKDLAMLRQRTQKLFIELMKDPDFNPEAAKHMVFDWKGNEGKMHFCKRCQRLKPFIEFAVFAKSQKLETCISCTWSDEIARSRIDLEPYRFMIRALRRDERRRKCFSSVAFIMQDKDFYNLIVNIWHCRSPISEVVDVYKLCLARWDVTKDWTPWNCVLLTDAELRAHINIQNLEETYAPHLIADIGYKHRLAQFQFSHLYKFDKQYVGSGRWFAVKGARYPKSPSEDSSDT